MAQAEEYLSSIVASHTCTNASLLVIARHEAIPLRINRRDESDGDCFVVPPRNDVDVNIAVQVSDTTM
jgi:hypothetical protein